MMRFDNIVSLPSGNTARNFRVRDLGNGRMQVSYEYTDRRRAHQVSRYFLAEFLNGRLESITACSARGGRVEFFKSSAILSELLEMLAEVEAKEQDGTSDLMDTLKTVGGMVMVNILITLAMLGIVWYNF